jgi:hypothetical protein
MQMSNELIIMSDSAEAAQEKTVTGWCDRFGQYFGADERTARWSGCTHQNCSDCGTVIEKNRTKCADCAKEQRIERFNTFPVEKWDGQTPVVLFDTERYFFGESILDFIADSDPAEDSDLRICKCRPHHLALIGDDNWCDDLAEDGELPEAVQLAVDALNEAIKAEGPVSWFEDAIAIDVGDLRERVNSWSSTHMSAHD